MIKNAPIRNRGIFAFILLLAAGMFSLPGYTASLEQAVDSNYYGSAFFYSPDGYYAGGSGYPFVFSPQYGLQDIPQLSGISVINLYGVSNNGSVIGEAYTGTRYEGFIWTQTGGFQTFGLDPSDFNSRALAISADGSTVVGQIWHSIAPLLREAFVWTPGGGMQNLGYIGGGDYTQANAVSADGSVIVGTGTDSGYDFRAWRWTQATGMVDLGDIPTGMTYRYSDARYVSDDGSVVGGVAYNDAGQERVFRWVDDGMGMADLGVLTGGTFLRGNGMNGSGSAFIGYGDNVDGYEEAFRWTSDHGLEGLGFLSTSVPGDRSEAKGMNADASVVVGTAMEQGTSHAFLWTETNGMRTLSDVLTEKGVNTAGWELQSANNISRDGKIVYGDGNDNGSPYTFIANLETGGLTTPGDLVDSLAEANKISQQALGLSAANLSQTLFAARNVSMMAMPISYGSSGFSSYGDDLSSFAALSPAAGGYWTRSRFSLYMTGTYSNGQNNNSGNYGLDGTIGLSMNVAPNLNIGVGVIGSGSHADLNYDGDSDLSTIGGSTIVSYEGDKGLRLYGAGFIAKLDAEMTRGYVNGASIDHSYGSTDGMGYGAAAQIGWEFPVAHDISVMPYNEWRWAKTELDAYQETGGAFPAQFSKQDNDSISSRLGVQFNYKQSDVVKWTFRAAWGHRVDDGGARFTATSAGLTQALGVDPGDRDWAEGAVGLGWQVSEKVRIGGEISGRTGDTAEPQVTLTFGASVNF